MGCVSVISLRVSNAGPSAITVRSPVLIWWRSSKSSARRRRITLAGQLRRPDGTPVDCIEVDDVPAALPDACSD